MNTTTASITAGVAGAIGAVTAFASFIDVDLAVRLSIIGIAAVVFVTHCFLLLRPHAIRRVGIQAAQAKPGTAPVSLVWRSTALAAAIASAAGVFVEARSFHSVRLTIHEPQNAKESQQIIFLAPRHNVISYTVSLPMNSRCRPFDVDGYASPSGGVGNPLMATASISLSDFKSRQALGLECNPSVKIDRIRTTSMPAGVDLLTPDAARHTILILVIVGGLLWVGGVLAFVLSS